MEQASIGIQGQSVVAAVAGVVDHDVQAAQCLGGVLDQASGSFGVPQIRAEHVDFGAKFTDVVGDLLQVGRRSSGQGKAGAGPRVRLGDAASDAAAGAGDEGATAVQAEGVGGGHRLAKKSRPPSMAMVAPETKSAAGEAR